MKRKTINEIKSALPEVNSQKVVDYADALDRILLLKRIFHSEDGKELIKELREGVILNLRKLLVAYKQNPDLATLLSLCATIDANYSLLSKVQDISLEKELRESLDEAVKDAVL